MAKAHDPRASAPIVLPFLKWAGGKRWLANRVLDAVPKTFGTYFEPFLGSAAVFFALKPAKAVLSDLNPQLINLYRAIRDDDCKVAAALREHQRNHSADYYYKMRSARLRTPHTRAAQFLYLNRTCWNGLYRVNLQGTFNVPIGTKTNVLLPSDDFPLVARTLRNVDIQCCDFESTIDRAAEGDVIFADPPYTIHHNFNGFVKYNEKIFSWRDQVRLRDSLLRAKKRGAHIIVTNANHSSVRDLYEEEFDLQPLSRKSVIAGASTARKTFEELFILSR